MTIISGRGEKAEEEERGGGRSEENEEKKTLMTITKPKHTPKLFEVVSNKEKDIWPN